MVTVTVGTGVGGAIVCDGRLIRGGFGAAGELGHLPIVPNGLPCGCGDRGCVEQYPSGCALRRFANELAHAGGISPNPADRRAVDGILDGTGIADLITAGDAGALAALRQLGGWIGRACASIASVLDPPMFVIGGRVAQTGDLILGPVRAGLLEALPARGYHPEPEFRIPELVNDVARPGW